MNLPINTFDFSAYLKSGKLETNDNYFRETVEKGRELSCVSGYFRRRRSAKTRLIKLNGMRGTSLFILCENCQKSVRKIHTYRFLSNFQMQRYWGFPEGRPGPLIEK